MVFSEVPFALFVLRPSLPNSLKNALFLHSKMRQWDHRYNNTVFQLILASTCDQLNDYEQPDHPPVPTTELAS
jgi:hypothetical protein